MTENKTELPQGNVKPQRVRSTVRRFWQRMRLYTRKLILSRSTAHQIAFGAAIGMFIAWTPTLGFQMAIAIPLCLLFKANPVAAVPPVWITNPLTAVPIYSFNYWIGRMMIGGPRLREFRAAMKQVFHTLETGTALDSLKELLVLGKEVFWPLILGSCLGGLVLGLALYGLTFISVTQIRSKLALRKQKRLSAQKQQSAGG